MNQQRVQETATAAAVLADESAKLLARIEYFLHYNSAQSIDWGAAQTPAYIQEDSDGNINSLNFTRQQVSNVIGSLDAMRALLRGESIDGRSGDHLGNLNHLPPPPRF